MKKNEFKQVCANNNMVEQYDVGGVIGYRYTFDNIEAFSIVYHNYGDRKHDDIMISWSSIYAAIVNDDRNELLARHTCTRCFNRAKMTTADLQKEIDGMVQQMMRAETALTSRYVSIGMLSRVAMAFAGDSKSAVTTTSNKAQEYLNDTSVDLREFSGFDLKELIKHLIHLNRKDA